MFQFDQFGFDQKHFGWSLLGWALTLSCWGCYAMKKGHWPLFAFTWSIGDCHRRFIFETTRHTGRWLAGSPDFLPHSKSISIEATDPYARVIWLSKPMSVEPCQEEARKLWRSKRRGKILRLLLPWLGSDATSRWLLPPLLHRHRKDNWGRCI